MIVDSVIVPGGISSTDGYVCAARKILEEPGFTGFLFKNWYNKNLKLGMMYSITQLWLLYVVLENFFCQKSRPYKRYIPIRQCRVVHPWVIFHQRQEFNFEKFFWAEVL